MLPAHEEILSIQLVTNNKYARQVRSCAAGFSETITQYEFGTKHGLINPWTENIRYQNVLWNK
jgi:hypothetical protein